MDESPITYNIPWDMRSKIIDNTKESYIIDNDKTWNKEKLQYWLSSDIVEKILIILIPRTEVANNIF